MRMRTGLIDTNDEDDPYWSLKNMMEDMCFMAKDGISKGNGVCMMN